VIKLGLNLFSIVILSLLVQGHNAWLAARSSGGIFSALEAITSASDSGWELVGMHAFRLAFMVALIVTVIEVLAGIYRLIRSSLTSDVSKEDFVLKVD
jgi:hypothetical protein